MKKLIVLFLIVFSSSLISAQNLVLNPSFEMIEDCPYRIGQLDLAEYWSSPTFIGTIDLYNTCARKVEYGMPNNYNGHQQAYGGDGYVGFVSYTTSGWSFREYVQGELASPLVKDVEYIFSCKVSLSDSSSHATPNIGVYFTSSQIGPNLMVDTPLPYEPQLYNTELSLSDTMSWMTLKWKYVAEGGESFFLIGNFDDNVTTIDKLILVNPELEDISSYYYLDDLHMETTTTSVLDNDYDIHCHLFPTLADDNIWLDINLENKAKVSVQIFNLQGQQFSTFDLGELLNTREKISVDDLPSDCYLLFLSVDNKIVTRKFMIR